MAPLLLQPIVIASFWVSPNWWCKFPSHDTSFPASHKAIQYILPLWWIVQQCPLCQISRLLLYQWTGRHSRRLTCDLLNQHMMCCRVPWRLLNYQVKLHMLSHMNMFLTDTVSQDSLCSYNVLHARICRIGRQLIHCILYAISGLIDIAMYCNSPKSCANEFKQSPEFLLGFWTIFTFGSRGIWTGLASSRPCLVSVFFIFWAWVILILPLDKVILMPTIFVTLCGAFCR